MHYALRLVVGMLLASAAGCAANVPEAKPAKFCSQAFCARGVGLVGKMVFDNGDFVTYGITYNGIYLVLYEGSGIYPNFNGEQVQFSGTNWSVHEAEGAWIADIKTGSRWPMFIRVSTSASKFSKEQFLEALSTISVKTEGA